jgi:hypothetical protein
VPVTLRDKPPRAVTYCRSNNKFGITYTYRCGLISQLNIVVLDARRSNKSALLINVYYAGGTRDLASSALQAIMGARINWTSVVFMCGDFNLHHNMWHLATPACQCHALGGVLQRTFRRAGVHSGK